jgi:hypothetical protein
MLGRGQNHAALMEHAARLLVIRVRGEHRANHAELVGHRGQVREQLADQDHVLRSGREMGAGRVHGCRERVAGKQVGEPNHANAAAHAPERLAPRDRGIPPPVLRVLRGEIV